MDGQPCPHIRRATRARICCSQPRATVHKGCTIRGVEDTVNEIKMLKRQMFGRANTDLLGKRVLLAI